MITTEAKKILKEKISKLKKKDIDLIICDFDYTIFSRDEQLKDSSLLRKNRGDKGTWIMKNIIGFENIIDKYYSGKEYPKTISSKLRENHDLILTAGHPELQPMKLKECKLNHINYSVVFSGIDKILEVIRYVIFELKYIPKIITIYEDRPQYFIEYKNFIEEVLGTTLVIKKVVMEGNDKEPIIEDIK